MTAPREAFEAALEAARCEPFNKSAAQHVRALHAAAVERAERAEKALAGNMAAEDDEMFELDAEVAALKAELLRMHDAVGGIASGLPKHVAALVAERDKAISEQRVLFDANAHNFAMWMKDKAELQATIVKALGERDGLQAEKEIMMRYRSNIAGLTAERDALAAELAAVREALHGVLSATHGCVFCDSGVLRKRVDGNPAFHANDCPFEAARQALARTPSAP